MGPRPARCCQSEPGPAIIGRVQKLLAKYALVALGLASPRIAVAQSAQQTPHPFAPGACGPVDSSYIRVAENTGGLPLFFQRSEVAQSTKLMMANSTQNHVTLWWAKGESPTDSNEFLVPVDSTLEQVVFTFSTDTRESTIDVVAPSGGRLTEAPQAEIVAFTCGRYIIVKKPAPGSYRVRVHSAGRFWVSVSGKSEIFLHGVQFVERGGRLGHEGMFPLKGQPLSGRPADLEASVAGPVRNVRFALVTPEDRTIRSIALAALDNQGDDHAYAGRFDLPDEPFRLVATGTDQNGVPFQRLHEGLFRPTTISLRLVEREDLFAGRSSALTFQVTNLGHADQFHLRAISAKSWSVKVDPTSLSLAHGETAKVVVTVSVPDGIPAYSGTDLVVTATSENDPAVNNGVVHQLSIERPRP
jgi:hypothetical protein